MSKDCFGASGLTEIFIPASVEVIEKKAFNFCNHLERMEIAKKSQLKIVEDDAFSFTKVSRRRVKFPLRTRVAKNAFGRDRDSDSDYSD